MSYDNSVAEAAYKVIKMELVNHQGFETQEQLGYEFSDYVNGYPVIYEVNVSTASREWV